MITLAQFMQKTLHDRNRELAALYPDTYRILDDVQIAERRLRIELLRREIRDLGVMIKLESTRDNIG